MREVVASGRRVVQIYTPSVRQAVRRRVGTASRVEWCGGGLGRNGGGSPRDARLAAVGGPRLVSVGPHEETRPTALVAVGGRR